MGDDPLVAPADGRTRCDGQVLRSEGVLGDVDDGRAGRATRRRRRRRWWGWWRRWWRWRWWRWRWRRRRPAARDREVDLHDPGMRVTDVLRRTRLELDSPGLVPCAALGSRAVRFWGAGDERRAVEMEVVERRVVVDLDRVRACGDSVELVDQQAVGITQLDRVVVVDLGSEDGIPRRRGRAARERRAADQHANRGGERHSGYVTCLHSPPSGAA